MGHGEVLRVGAHVCDGVELVAENLAVARSCDGGRADPAATVDGRRGRLAAGFGPANRPTGCLRRKHTEEVLCVDAELRSKPTADLGRNGVHVVRRETEDLGHCSCESVGHLGRAVELHFAVAGVVVRHDGPRLDGRRDQLLVAELVAHDDDIVALLGLLDGGPMVFELEDTGPPVVRIPGEQHIRLGILVCHHLVLGGLLHVDDRRQRVVIDEDRIDRVLGEIPVGGDDHRNRFTCMVDRTVGKQRAERADPATCANSVPRSRTSSAVKTASTPSIARAADASTELIRAWANGLRTNATASSPARWMSST